MEVYGVTPDSFTSWCEEHLIITRYTLATSYLPSSKFGQPGFQGTVTYEIKGPRTTVEAQWISPLARFALFAGIGYKTTMGMGQVRCTNVRELSPSLSVEKEERT
jgi:CRISPR-associated endoribonuclease Cas6